MRKTEHILDEWLVLAARDGNAAAFEALVRRLQPGMKRHAWRLSGNGSAAADITQESWLAVARGLRRLHDPAGFRGWVFRIVTHKAADWVRKQERNRELTKTVASREPMRRSSDLESDAANEAGASQRQLRDAIAQLSPELRAVVSLHYGEGLAVADVAQALGIPPGTVKSRLHNARERLRHLLERSEP